MVLLAEAENLVTFFVAIETLSIPLYILCATNLRREGSLESGLKYLIVGSLGSATLLYGMAFIYGGTGSTDFAGIAHGIEAHGMLHDPLILIGIALAAVGLAFKTSIAPFHQWTPDVYQGAPTPITSFMAVATKAAAFAVFVRFFVVALGPETGDWQMGLAILAAISIVVGNVGALAQTSLKRLLGYSGVAQAGYMLGGLVVASEKGISSLVFYLAIYLFMNLAAFAVIVARERETPFGDDIRGVRGLGAERPALAWPLTISMLALAGLPATAGFIGKLYLIEALVEGNYTWLAIFIVGRDDDLARLLPAGDRGDVDEPGDERRARRPAARRPRRSPAPRRKPTRSTPRPAAAGTWSAPRSSPPPSPSSSASSRSRWSTSPPTPAPRSSRRTSRAGDARRAAPAATDISESRWASC